MCDYGVFVLLLLLEGSAEVRREGGGVGGIFWVCTLFVMGSHALCETMLSAVKENGQVTVRFS